MSACEFGLMVQRFPRASYADKYTIGRVETGIENGLQLGWQSRALGHSAHSPMASSQGRFVVFRVIKDWEDVGRLLDHLGESITTFQVVAAFKCLAGMKKLPPEAADVLTKLASISTRLSDRMLSEHHAIIIASCGSLGYWNSGMLNAFAKTLLKYRLHGRMSIENYTRTITGLGSIHTVLSSRFKRALRSGENVLLFKLFDLFMERLGTQISRQCELNKFTPQNLVAILQGYAKMRQSEPVGEWLWLMEIVRATLLPSLVLNYTEKEVVSILVSLRWLGFSCQEVPVWFAREIMHEDRMDDYSEGQLSEIMYNLGVMEFYDNVNVGYAIMAEVTNYYRLQSFTREQLLDILQGCAMLGYVEEIPLQMLVEEVFLRCQQPQCPPSYITKMLETLIMLEYKDKKSLASLWTSIFHEESLCRRDILRKLGEHTEVTRQQAVPIMQRFSMLGLSEWGVKPAEDTDTLPVSKTGFESPGPQVQLTDWTIDEDTGTWMPPLYRSRTAFRAGIGWKPLKEGRRVPLGRNTLKRKRQRQQKFRHQQEARDLKKQQKEERLRKKEFHDKRRAASWKSRRASIWNEDDSGENVDVSIGQP